MIAANIGKYLNDNGIKQTWLADKLEIPVSTLNGIIKGRSELKADMFITICNILNVPPEEFVKGGT